MMAVDTLKLIHQLEPQPEDEVLQILVGTGYMGALLSRMVKEIYITEHQPELLELAARQLQGYQNVHLAKSSFEWPEQREFDRILIGEAIAPERHEEHESRARMLLRDRYNGTVIFPMSGPYNRVVRHCARGQIGGIAF